MVWTVCLTVALCVMVATLFSAAFVHYKTLRFKKIISPSKLIMAGVIIASVVMFLPIYSGFFDSDFLGCFKNLTMSVHNTIRLFVVDGDFEFILDNLSKEAGATFNEAYTTLFAFLFVAAPFLTFGFVLSFFVNASAYNRYIKSFFKEVYVFSELNEKSITLATDIKKNGRPGKRFNRRRQIIFTDVFDKNDEPTFELIEKAEAIGAICFKKDIAAIKFGFHSKRKPLCFFVMGEDEAENMRHCLELADKYNNSDVLSEDAKAKKLFGKAAELAENKLRKMSESEKEGIKKAEAFDYELTDENIKKIENQQYTNISIYVFSTDTESALLVNTVNVISRRKKQRGKNYKEATAIELADKIIEGETLMLPSDFYKKIRIRRINDVQSLVFRTLYDDGLLLFEGAEKNGNTSNINALVLGMGQHGKEMLKALCWYCQMDNYRLYINAFDLDKKAHLRFKASCPELCDDNHNKRFDIPGEAGYSLDFHPETDVTTSLFFDTLKKLPKATYIFVALGNDSMNIDAAIKLRSFYLREFGAAPKIHTVVYSSDKKRLLQNITDSKGNPYEIDFIGDLESSYTEAVIVNSALEREALKRHLVYDKTDFEGFWRVEYNYRSSLASALHKRLKLALRVPGIEVDRDKRTKEHRAILENLEHRRWNAYVRSEGYSYGPKRNNIAKTHPDLILFDELSKKEKNKDNY